MKTHRPERRLYRSRRGVFLGVCRGLAESRDIGVLWIRLGVVGALILTGFWPVLVAYVVAALLLRPEPVLPVNTDASREFYTTYVNDRALALRRLTRIHEDLQQRIRHMEDIVTSRDFQWQRRMERP